MDVRQRVEQRQKPVLSQSLIQSSRMLELALPELRAVIEEELEQNPVLEEEIKAEAPRETPEIRQTSERETSEPAPDPDDELLGYEKPIPNKKENLHDHLSRQLRINTEDEEKFKAGMAVILSIDENGYLRVPPEVIAEESGFSCERVAEMLKLIQSFDPAGIGARDLKECLLLQLDRAENKDPLLRGLIEEHLQDMAAGQWQKLIKALKCSPEELKEKIIKIHSLEPKPGRGYSSEETIYVIPDVTIEEKDNQLVVLTREETMPVLRINPLYRAMLRNKKIDDKTKDFIREKIANGNNLMNAIQNRRHLLVRVMEIIASIQKEALTEGFEKLNPLSLKEVAEMTNIHESTISRIVMHKYVQTPVGIYPLRKFFSSGLKTSTGADISSQRVRLKIKELIDSENKNKPLRDQEIVLLLKQAENIDVARRTVVKYREAMKIPSAPKRRKEALTLNGQLASE
ncbi:MAG: RNA polymerase factor sigma-54 [Candidatus Omnitrophota bacterium]